MRVLFVTAAFKAHLYVQVPLAAAFRNAGHDVRVAAAPDMADIIATTGLSGFPVGGTIDLAAIMSAPEQAPGPPRSGPVRKPAQTEYTGDDPFTELEYTTWGHRTLFNHEEIFDDLIKLGRAWQPDLIIRDPFVLAAAVAARVCGAVDVRMLFGSDTMGQIRADCFGANGGPQRSLGKPDPVRDWLQPILESHGQSFDEEIVLGLRSVIGWPTWTWQPAGGHYLPTRPLAFHGPYRVESWMHEEPARPRVCVTLGISHRDHGFGQRSWVDTAFDAVADLDAEVIALFNPAQIGSRTVPSNVRVVEFAPLNVLLPTCSAVVHHGGYGAMAAALEYGVPQLIVPNIESTEKWWGPIALANGLEEQGAGAYVADSDQLTAELLHDHLVKALGDPGMAANAIRLSQEARSVPSPNDTVRVLEDLVAEQHAPGRR
jgi:L-2-deoxyfucosyltransferase